MRPWNSPDGWIVAALLGVPRESVSALWQRLDVLQYQGVPVPRRRPPFAAGPEAGPGAARPPCAGSPVNRAGAPYNDSTKRLLAIPGGIGTWGRPALEGHAHPRAETTRSWPTASSGALRAAGYAVDQVGTGTEADAAQSAHEFDLLIPRPGIAEDARPGRAPSRFAPRGVGVPVLILTAADSVEQRVKGLDLGADDMACRSRCEEAQAWGACSPGAASGASSRLIEAWSFTLDQPGRVAHQRPAD